MTSKKFNFLLGDLRHPSHVVCRFEAKEDHGEFHANHLCGAGRSTRVLVFLASKVVSNPEIAAPGCG